MIRSNFHTHTHFCDGKDSPHELADRAVELGFDSLGFSGHSYTAFDADYCMSPERIERYIAEINALKDEYGSKLNILCGIEQDLYSSVERERFDYVIGSVHYIKIAGKYLPIDLSAEMTADIIRTYFAGDFCSYAAAYYETVSEVCDATRCDIIGHIDIIMKYADLLGFEQSDRYLSYAENAVKSLCRYNVPFEINTGAMARGTRAVPYPTVELLGMLKSNGGSVIVSSDCHDKDYLDFGFVQAAELAKKAGFTTAKVLTENGYGEIKL